MGGILFLLTVDKLVNALNEMLSKTCKIKQVSDLCIIFEKDISCGLFEIPQGNTVEFDTPSINEFIDKE